LKVDSIIDIVKAIDFIDNDESIIALSKPFFDLFENYSTGRVLKAVYQIPESERKTTIEKTLSLLSKEKEENPYLTIYMSVDIEKILSFVFETKDLEPKQRDYIWSIGKQTKQRLGDWEQTYDWSPRIELMRILSTINWVPDKRLQTGSWDRWIEAPFSAQDVIKHAHTYAEIYDMNFLESTAGRILTNEIIKNLNAHMVPQHDFASLSSAYNRGSPSAGYNKSLIADYASSLKMRLDVIKILKKITWIPDPREKIYGSWISAPFSARDVIDHANTKPEIYDMKFLESPIGLRVISEIINKLNAHMVPQHDFASLSSAYNRSRPDAGYNKSLIADYVSSLKSRLSS